MVVIVAGTLTERETAGDEVGTIREGLGHRITWLIVRGLTHKTL
jgi:hypothetical protein